MRSYRVSQLSAAFVVLAATLAVVVGLVMVHELDGISHAIEMRERIETREEIATALAGVDAGMRRMAEDLADWDETRQQLVFDDYYALWRDNRARDAGMISEGVVSLALYGKDGVILMPRVGDDPIPQTLPDLARGPFLLMHADGELLAALFEPVSADPNGAIIMGYVGVQLRLLDELARLRRYRFADLTGSDLTGTPRQVSNLSELQDDLSFSTRANPSLVFLREVFERKLFEILLFVIAALLLASWLLHQFLVRPLQTLSRRISALQGDPNADAGGALQTTPVPIYELEQVGRSFDSYHRRLTELNENLERSSRDFFEQARRDALTGSFNRRALEEDFQARVTDANTPACALILFDCDHFKAINDSYGHTVGDKVIVAISWLLQTCLDEGSRLYRLGGDEFATLLVDVADAEVFAVAERCLERVRLHDFQRYGLPEPVSISVGLTSERAADGELSLTLLHRRADLAMYSAKRPGSRKIVTYQPEMSASVSLIATDRIAAVYQALRDPSRLQMHYQPIVCLPSREVMYAEALVRIRFSSRLFSPGDIFPIVQTRKLDAEFDLVVIEALKRDMTAERQPIPWGISINISAAGIVHSMVIGALLELRRRDPARKLVVEITETALITQMRTASENIRKLREAGFVVALDDFGSGYSSLGYLASMPVDVVKFDISMVRQLDHPEPNHRAIAEEAARMVKNAGYDIVAEGIETEDQAERVLGIGFGFAQGYLFGRPERGSLGAADTVALDRH